jgi:hypothetical protein
MDSLHLNVNLSFQQLVDLVKQLPPAEKSKLNDAIWDGDMAIPLEHQKLVLERIQKARQDPSLMLDWDGASKTLKP